MLGRLAGERWSDFNTHDPGITILEALCYAITDLAYRTSLPIPDLIAGSSHPGLPEPARRMAEALRSLPDQSRPSDAYMPGLLDGLENIDALVGEGFASDPARSRGRPVRAVRAV